MISTIQKYSIYITSICTMLLFQHCEKKNNNDDTYFGSKIMILGHRGMGDYFKKPGDTYESILPAINVGVDGCEIDVQITKDTILILLHDLTLNPSTTCYGKPYNATWNEIQSCKYYSFQNNVFVSSADEVFSQIPNITNYYFSFDSQIQDDVADPELYKNQLLRAIKRICEKYAMSNNVFIEGNAKYLRRARELGLTNKFFLTGVVSRANIDTCVNNSFFGICTQMENFEIGADSAHIKGLYIMSYTPNNYYSNVIAIKKKIDILQTDDPISILKLFNRFNYEYVIP